MTEKPAVAHRFQFSVRSLLAATAILALLLVPIAWVAGQREQMRLAREEAIRAVILAERYRSEIKERRGNSSAAVGQAESRSPSRRTYPVSPDGATQIERLERENAELKDTVELLRREVERLKGRGR
jgi:predicted RNase H-like nuclease (RuvC/YqgF family)